MKSRNSAFTCYRLFHFSALLLLPLHVHSAESPDNVRMQDIPPLWLEVNEQDGQQVIQTHCDAGVASIEIKHQDEQWQLFHFLGQDGDAFIIKDRTEIAGEVEAYTLTLTYHPSYYINDQTHLYTLTFLDEKHHYATWVREGRKATYTAAKRDDNAHWALNGLSPLEDIPILPPVDDCSQYF